MITSFSLTAMGKGYGWGRWCIEFPIKDCFNQSITCRILTRQHYVVETKACSVFSHLRETQESETLPSKKKYLYDDMPSRCIHMRLKEWTTQLTEVLMPEVIHDARFEKCNQTYTSLRRKPMSSFLWTSVILRGSFTVPCAEWAWNSGYPLLSPWNWWEAGEHSLAYLPGVQKGSLGILKQYISKLHKVKDWVMGYWEKGGEEPQ